LVPGAGAGAGAGSAVFKARSLHRDEAYDAVWAMMANQAGFGALLFKLARPSVPPRVPTVL